jgi:hypothetical protein
MSEAENWVIELVFGSFVPFQTSFRVMYTCNRTKSLSEIDFTWPSEIERIPKPSPAEFYREYVAANKPVIITNAFDDWPALKRWDLDYLRKKAGALQISIDLTPAGHGDCIVEKDGKNYFVKPMQYKTRFGSHCSSSSPSRPPR